MHSILLNDMKSKHLWKALRYPSFYVFNSTRQPVAQELDKIYVLYMRASFVDPLRESVSKAKSLLGLNVCWCTSEACKYKNAIIMAATMTTAVLAAKGILQNACIKHRDFLDLCMKVLRANGDFHSKSFNSTKMDYVLAGLNVNILFRKSVRKMHLSLMMFRKQGVLNNQMLRLGCCLPPPLWKFLATCLFWG